MKLSGVDVGARAEIYRRLRELADGGVAVVVSSSAKVTVRRCTRSWLASSSRPGPTRSSP